MKKHTWSDRFVVDQHTTFRRCWDCSIIKITRHESEGGREAHWTEWRKDGKPFASDVTPPCTVAITPQTASAIMDLVQQ